MQRLTWLADVLRAAGCHVIEHDGWETRGKHLPRVDGIVWHHTATGPNVSDKRVVDLLIGGRPDLAGPLCQLGLRRDGTYDVIAAGRANHNGYGEWGNASLGIEAYNDGVGEPWPKVQLDAYVTGTAALLARLDLGASRVKGHKETDPRRKIDPRNIDMDRARSLVADLLAPAPPIPTPQPEDPDMAKVQRDPRDNKVWAISGAGRWWVRSTPDLKEKIAVGMIEPVPSDADGDLIVPVWPVDKVEVLDRIPIVTHAKSR